MKGVADVYPLTPSQLGILYDALRDPDPELYFEQVRFDLVGDVDPDTFHAAWTDTFDRHPALRTVWLWEGLDDPVQVVREHVELPWTELDMTSNDEPGAALDELARHDRKRGFDLRRPPVSRVTVVKLDADRSHLIWSFHHIMLDGWSTAQVLDEVLDRCAGREVADSAPFRDHVAWLAEQDLGAARSHWRQLLAGFDHPTIVAGRRRTTDEPFDRARVTLSLDEAATESVIATAREQRVTPNTLVQAAWALTLSCLSGDDDVVFGVTGSGRPAEVPGVESIVGMFLSTLPMRVRVDRDRTVGDLWRELQGQQLDLTQYQYSSLADIARESSIPAGVAMFETALIFENFPRPDDVGRPFTVEHHRVFEQTRFPLTVLVGAGDHLEAVALYDRSQFEDGAVEALLDVFRDVLTSTVAEATLPLTSVSALADTDRHRLLDELNRTDRPVPDSTVPDEIATRARLRPDSVALIDGDRSMSYGELERAGRAIGSRLGDDGVGRGDTVLVAVDRSIDAVVAMLAVMRAGAAYVPVDPATPRGRLDAIVDDARPSLVIGNATGLSDLGIPSIDIAGLAGSTDAATGSPTGASPDDPMFVVFTSGSTGRPKGVPGTHRAVLNRCAWEARVAPYDTDEVTAQKTTFAFVDHVAELWAPLVAGRTVAIIPDDVVRTPDAFVDALARHRIRRIVMVPSLLDALLDACPDLGDRLPELTRWTLSGERLDATLVDRFRSALPAATLLNVYGMSEVMADATAYEVTSPGAPAPERRGPIPIGTPIDNQRTYVIDRAGRPAAVGVPGEIHVSGVGLMTGYWRRDDLTAERIADNPFGDGDHARWYCTGDIGRWSPDGQLEYLGRLDRQVKVRGVRIELGDVEAATRELSDVVDAVVVDAASAGSPTRLRAYIVADDGIDVAELRRQLSELVPAALVPSEFERIDEIPLLPSGKVNRAALPEPLGRCTDHRRARRRRIRLGARRDDRDLARRDRERADRTRRRLLRCRRPFDRRDPAPRAGQAGLRRQPRARGAVRRRHATHDAPRGRASRGIGDRVDRAGPTSGPDHHGFRRRPLTVLCPRSRRQRPQPPRPRDGAGARLGSDRHPGARGRRGVGTPRIVRRDVRRLHCRDRVRTPGRPPPPGGLLRRWHRGVRDGRPSRRAGSPRRDPACCSTRSTRRCGDAGEPWASMRVRCFVRGPRISPSAGGSAGSAVCTRMPRRSSMPRPDPTSPSRTSCAMPCS